jgi:phage terminase large subunit-like protein
VGRATLRLAPQPGPQYRFAACPADVAIYGGAAGGGKTFSLLLEHLRHATVQGYRGLFLRRESVDLMKGGGAWDEAMGMYVPAGAASNSQLRKMVFPCGASVDFSHLQHEHDKLAYQSSQFALITFDELTHFSASQFWYMLSRNRSQCGVRPYIRAGCNPESTSWVRDLIEWWIGPDGYPIPERDGVLRWMLRRDDDIVWFDSEEDALAHCVEGEEPLSLTFIAARLSDNVELERKDPGYRAKLMMLPKVEREQLLGGNWDASYLTGIYQHARWVTMPPVRLPRGLRWVRYWDMAATEPSPANPDPDWTAGVLVARHIDREGTERIYLRDGRWCRKGPAGVEEFVRAAAEVDGRSVTVTIEEEPGSSGKSVVSHYQRSVLKGYAVSGDRPTGDKVTRQRPVVAAAENGCLVFVDDDEDADWIIGAQRWAATYPEGKRDFWDAVAGGFKVAPITRSVDDRKRSRHSEPRKRPGAIAPPSRM